MKEKCKMFSFFHRTPKITLDCFTDNKFVHELTPIVRATKTFPKYFQDLPPYEYRLRKDDEKVFVSEPIQNLRNCQGFLEYFSKGITIRYWADLYLEISKEGYKYYSSFTIPEKHNKEQIGEAFENYHHIKLSSPWYFREKTGLQFAWIGAEWNLDNYNFKVLPAVINFNINCGTNINIMLPKEEKSYIIPVGIPLVNIIPLTDKKIEIKNHLVSENEYNKMSRNSGDIYFHGWRTVKKLLKENAKKCPFGFGD